MSLANIDYIISIHMTQKKIKFPPKKYLDAYVEARKMGYSVEASDNVGRLAVSLSKKGKAKKNKK